MKKIMVIGASGLLGSNLVRLLKVHSEVMEVSFTGSGLTTDIADSQSLKRLFNTVGPVDGIACVAGMVHFVPWAQATDLDWSHGLANKLMGQINIVRLGAALVRDGGAITLTTGVLAQHPMPGSCIVTTVNCAIEGVVRAAALELGSRIRINAVSPGWVAETMQAMGNDATQGLPAADVARHILQQLEFGATGSVLVAARKAKVEAVHHEQT
jgi:NAD(P)-dependent dehydrogenase (short-subunit alcohol dehydrogenase family)